MRWIVRRLPQLSAKAWIGIAIAAAFVVSEVTGAKGDLRIDEQARACQTYQRAADEMEQLQATADDVCEHGLKYVPEATPEPMGVSPGCTALMEDQPTKPLPRTRVAPPAQAVPYFAELPGALPPDGTPTVAGVKLPKGSRCPRYWASDGHVPNAHALAQRLAAAFPQTGLWPVIWENADDPDAYAWFGDDPAEVAAVDPEDALRAIWAEYIDPAGSFPGLAAPSGATAPDAFAAFAASRSDYQAQTPMALLLVPVNRPADVITAIGTVATEVAPAPAVNAIVRSWEERFGAVVTTLGPGELGLAVGDPPRSHAQARKLAAEQLAFAPEEGYTPADLDALAGALRADARDSTIEGLSRGFWIFGWPD